MEVLRAGTQQLMWTPSATSSTEDPESTRRQRRSKQREYGRVVEKRLFDGAIKY
jgi:hypothetical protein